MVSTSRGSMPRRIKLCASSIRPFLIAKLMASLRSSMAWRLAVWGDVGNWT